MDTWKEDSELKKDLEKYVQQNLKREELLDFVKRKYTAYCWSVRTLARRLSFFNIKYIDYDTDLNTIREAVSEEMNGPGRLLGYRALHKKLREIHNLNVPRNIVYAMMQDVDPSGLDERSGVGQPKRPRRTGTFTCKVLS